MAKVRSPNYPVMDLGAALKAARKALDKDNRNKMSQAALGKHLGHDSLSGPALGKIGALRAYGLVEGKGDELRISDDAVYALMAPEGSPERSDAIANLASRPKLFQEIRKDFPTVPSQDNLKFWLIKRKFATDAAEKAAKCYLATMRLVAGEPPEYDSTDEEPAQPENQPVNPRGQTPPKPGFTPPPPPPPLGTIKPGLFHETFNLEEGPVTLSYPVSLSPDSFQDFLDHLNIIIRQAKRRSEAEERAKEFERRLNPGDDE